MTHTLRSSRQPVALVAGGSRGLGLLIARRLLDRGYTVALLGRDADTLDRAEAYLAAPQRVVTYVCDVADRARVGEVVATVENEVGPIETAITVAGIIHVGPAESMTFQHFDDAINIMLFGPINVARHVEPYMRARRKGHIGTVTSVGGVVSPPHLLPYAAAKFGAVGFSDGMVAALTGTGVTATTIVPGLMRTGSHERAYFTGEPSKEFAWFSVSASLPGLAMNADRAATAIVEGVLAGKPMVVLTPLTWLAFRVRGLAPSLTTRAMGLANMLLPKAGGATETVEGRVAGKRLRSPAVAVLTTLGRRAARRNNER